MLFADTFNRYFEPENIEAAIGGAYRRRLPCASAASGRRFVTPLCCGRTFLSVGLVEEARREAERCVAALAPFAPAAFRSSGWSRAACSAFATKSLR